MRHNLVLFLVIFLSCHVSFQPVYSQVKMRCKDCNKVFDLPKDILKDKKLGLALDAISKQSAGAELSYEIREILSAFGANENFNRIKLQNNSICKAIHCLQEDPDEARARINHLFDKVFGTYDEDPFRQEFPTNDPPIVEDFSETEMDTNSNRTIPPFEDSLSEKTQEELLRIGEQVKSGNCSCLVKERFENEAKVKMELTSHEGIESSIIRVLAPGDHIAFKGCKVSLLKIMDEKTISIRISDVREDAY